jgi:hypothetical protein
MKSLVLAFAFLSSVAQAESVRQTFTCTFTEPFITTVYETLDMSLTIYEPFTTNNAPPQRIENVRIKDLGGNKIALVTKTGQALQYLERNFKGSDGMSDKVYPFEVIWMTDRVRNGKFYGGCDLQVYE